MPKIVTSQDIMNQLDWVGKLPETVWSRGIMDTAQSVAGELSVLEAERLELDDKMKARQRVLRLMPARAEREAKLMYPQSEVLEAKGLKTVVDGEADGESVVC